ncbi:hypothetical protein TRFO_41787 [Tritrichomonas foetus]|uniref:Uncharacterized protein n=1 Tax=Tritrichomonas foetus TaxID=1144522 RepID=A0A1J4L3H4_9EUKA|nr:hypothetical protein TRFO_41787 [Tritrichomonas foetus]|eukprot:OHT16502.1 hypothetical protein TRFO_41787 [Tritrichomonas foetus]
MIDEKSILEHADPQALIYIELQDILLKINAENFESSFDCLSKLSFIRSVSNLNGLVHNFIVATHYNSQTIPLLSKLVAALINLWKSDPEFSSIDFPAKFSSIFIEQLLHRFSFRKSFLSNITFLYYLFVNEVFTLDFIIDQLDPIFYAPFKQTRSCESESSATPLYLTCFLCFFGYHIEKERNETFQKYLNSLSKSLAYQCYSPEYMEFYFFKEFESLRENDWNLWHCKLGVNSEIRHTSIFDAIRKDDVNALQKYSCAPDFDYNTRVPPTVFEPSVFLIDSSEPTYPTILQLAAFHGSINCFKFLKLNGSDPTLKDRKNRPLFHYIVANGNVELTRIVEQDGQKTTEDLIQLAIEFHHFDLYQWLYEHHFQQYLSENEPQEARLQKQLPLFRSAASVDNLKVILHLLSSSMYVNSADNFGWTALHYAAENGHFEVVQLLLKQPDIDVNAQDQKGWTPLHRATMNGHFDVVRILLSNKNVNVNRKNYSGVF